MNDCFRLCSTKSEENKYHNGHFKDAMQAAFDMCISPSTIINVYDSSNRLIAMQTLTGAVWIANDIKNQL